MGYDGPQGKPLPLALKSGGFRSDFEGGGKGGKRTSAYIVTPSYFCTKTKLVKVTSVLKELTNAIDLLEHLFFHPRNFQIIVDLLLDIGEHS